MENTEKTEITEKTEAAEKTEKNEKTEKTENKESNKPQRSSGVKRGLEITKSVITWVVVVVAVAMMIFTLVSSAFVGKQDRSLFGFKFFIVLSDSMSATDFSAGDIIITKNVKFDDLKEGDVITFISQNNTETDKQNQEGFGKIVTHKIRAKTVDATGKPAFITYGTTTGVDDQTLVTEEFIIGQYKTKLPKVGHFFNFLKTTPGYIVCILIPFALLMISQGINCIRLFRRYRAEQLADLRAEREKLEQERLESQRQAEEERAQTMKMMEELLALKQQLNNAGVTTPKAEDTPKASENSEQSENE